MDEQRDSRAADGSAVRFLHTSDWQLGMTRWFLREGDGEAQARYSADRLEAVRRLGRLAQERGAEFIVVAAPERDAVVERVRAAGEDAVFIAVRLPYGVQQDEADAQLALDFIRADREVTVDIKPGVDALEASVEAAIGDVTDYHKGNVKARARMVAQYTIGGQLGLIVLGTDHAAEAVTGFYTKHGDGAADVLPLAGLTKGQGKELLRLLEADERLWQKVPTADLLDDRPGQTDEAELGVSYEQIDAFLRGEPVDDIVAEQIIAKYDRSQHKRQLPPGPADDWWRPSAGPLFE